MDIQQSGTNGVHIWSLTKCMTMTLSLTLRTVFRLTYGSFEGWYILDGLHEYFHVTQFEHSVWESQPSLWENNCCGINGGHVKNAYQLLFPSGPADVNLIFQLTTHRGKGRLTYTSVVTVSMPSLSQNKHFFIACVQSILSAVGLSSLFSRMKMPLLQVWFYLWPMTSDTKKYYSRQTLIIWYE